MLTYQQAWQQLISYVAKVATQEQQAERLSYALQLQKESMQPARRLHDPKQSLRSRRKWRLRQPINRSIQMEVLRVKHAMFNHFSEGLAAPSMDHCRTEIIRRIVSKRRIAKQDATVFVLFVTPHT